MTIGLPTTFHVRGLVWEGSDRFLVDVVDPAARRRALVRCAARTGECELAAHLPTGALVAHG